MSEQPKGEILVIDTSELEIDDRNLQRCNAPWIREGAKRIEASLKKPKDNTESMGDLIGCLKCGCVRAGHHGLGIGCEGLGDSCRCDGVFEASTTVKILGKALTKAYEKAFIITRADEDIMQVMAEFLITLPDSDLDDLLHKRKEVGHGT